MAGIRLFMSCEFWGSFVSLSWVVVVLVLGFVEFC